MQIINRLLKPEQKMKRFAIFATALVAVLTAGTAAAQEKGVVFSGGADVASNYVWRGVTQAGVSLQPTLTMTLGNFSATAWGSVDFAATSYKEMDITLAYALGPVTLSVADLYWEGSSADRGLVNRHYFHFGSDSPHRVEVGANWCVSRKVPLTLSWYTIVFGAIDVNSKGERAYSSYFEVAYPFTVKGIDMKAGVGAVPWNAYGTYGIDKDFYVQNVFLNAGKMWEIKGAESMQIGFFTNLIWNPAMEDVNFVGGISFRM